MSASLLRSIANQLTTQQNTINGLTSIESPAAFLTVTRTATQAITTAGTAIVWQSAVRNQGGFGVSGSTITFPTEGYYCIFTSFALVANTNTHIRLQTGTVTAFSTFCTPFSTGSGFIISTTFGYYAYANSDIVIALHPTANTTVNRNAEQFAAPSPYCHIVQLSAALP
jgi:hypothetical protein